jgi:ornithine carbamoyltransferase
MLSASPDAVFLHCLPRKPEEVTDDVREAVKSLLIVSFSIIYVL